MNRRDFMYGTMAGLAAARFLGVPRLVHAAGSEEFPRAQWLRQGLISAGGTHEPYIFLVRRGGAARNVREFYEQQQSEPFIRSLKEQGVEVFHTHLYKGFGMAAESAEMEDTRKAARFAHSIGMRVDTYIQWNSMMYETFFAEEPRAKDWIQRDLYGQPILLPYGFQQSYRYRPCVSHQEYLDYLKKIVRYAVVEVKTDFIHFDNFDLNLEPDSCHCPACTEGFRKYLRTKYSAEQRRLRFGFENTDFVNPPQWNRENPPDKMEIIFDPAIQEWIEFRCQLLADSLKQVSMYAKSMNPEVAIEINPHGITGENRAWENAIDHARLLKWTDVYVTEEENPAGLAADGRLISKIRSYKLARRYKNILLTQMSENPVAIAEALAFNQTLGHVGNSVIQPKMKEFLAFYRKYRDLYIGTEDVASVAVLRSHPSITYHNADAQLHAILIEQALLQSRIPFDLVFDEHLADLSKYNVLILPDSECLSDEQVAQIRRFVERGGGLVASGAAGIYDEWRRLRPEPGLQGIVEGQPKGDEYIEHVENMEKAEGGKPVRHEKGKIRTVYFENVIYDGPMPEKEPYFRISNRFWKRPKNWQEIVEAVRWAGRDEQPVSVGGPSSLIANAVEQTEKRRLLLHLVNYDAGKTAAVKGIEVRCELPAGARAKEVTVYTPEAAAPVALSASGTAGTAAFTVPEVKVYSVIAVSW